jgi:hypothetical protein
MLIMAMADRLDDPALGDLLQLIKDLCMIIVSTVPASSGIFA